MKVLLEQDVKGTGKKGEIVNVSDGYARNYLLPRKLASEATADAINAIKLKEKAKAAQAAKEKGMHVYVVGIGKPEGSPIPDGKGSFKKDKSGQVVVSRLNEDMCKEIAGAGGGIYVRADNSNTASRALQKELNKIATAEIETKIFTDYNEQYQSFVMIAFFLLVLDFFIFSRKNKTISKLNLFGDK